MRTHILTGLFLVTLAGCAHSGSSSNAGSVDEQDQYNYHVEFTSYADALNEYAKVMPVIGHDSESAWAASEVQYMRDKIEAGSLSVRENLALLYRMQAMLAYGLSYEFSIYAMIAGGNEYGYGDMAFHSIHDFNEGYSKLQTDRFKDEVELCLLGNLSFFYTQLYAELFNELTESEVFSTEDRGFSMNQGGIIRGLKEKDLGSSDILKVQAVLDGSSFIRAYAPLIQGFCTSDEAHDRQDPVIMDAFRFFDEHRKALEACDGELCSIHDLLEKDFDAYVKEFLRYRVTLLGFLTENIKRIQEGGELLDKTSE